MQRVIAEMFRNSGPAHRFALLLPAFALVLIVALAIFGGYGREQCLPTLKAQFWVQAATTVIYCVVFWAWQRKEVLRVALTLIDRGVLSFVRPDRTRNEVVLVSEGRAARAAISRLPVVVEFFLLVFPIAFALFLLDGETVFADMCDGSIQNARLALFSPAVFGLLMSTCFLAMSCFFQWVVFCLRISNVLAARTLERDGGPKDYGVSLSF